METILFETLEDIVGDFMDKGFNDKIEEVRGILHYRFHNFNLRLLKYGWGDSESDDESDTDDSPNITEEEVTAPSPRASTSNMRDNGDSNVGNCPVCLESMLDKDSEGQDRDVTAFGKCGHMMCTECFVSYRDGEDRKTCELIAQRQRQLDGRVEREGRDETDQVIHFQWVKRQREVGISCPLCQAQSKQYLRPMHGWLSPALKMDYSVYRQCSDQVLRSPNTPSRHIRHYKERMASLAERETRKRNASRLAEDGEERPEVKHARRVIFPSSPAAASLRGRNDQIDVNEREAGLSPHNSERRRLEHMVEDMYCDANRTVFDDELPSSSLVIVFDQEGEVSMQRDSSMMRACTLPPATRLARKSSVQAHVPFTLNAGRMVHVLLEFMRRLYLERRTGKSLSLPDEKRLLYQQFSMEAQNKAQDGDNSLSYILSTLNDETVLPLQKVYKSINQQAFDNLLPRHITVKFNSDPFGMTGCHRRDEESAKFVIRKTMTQMERFDLLIGDMSHMYERATKRPMTAEKKKLFYEERKKFKKWCLNTARPVSQ